MTGRLNNHTDDWGLVLRNGAAADNAAPQNGVGSAYVNDIYIRAVGKWASQLSSDSGTLCGGATYLNGVGWYNGASCRGVDLPGCPAGYYLAQIGPVLVGNNGAGMYGGFVGSCVKW